MESMDTQRRRSILALIFIYCAISCLSSTSSGQVRDLRVDSVLSSNLVGTNYEDVFNSNQNPSFCISDRYIMQSYFTTHTSLNDSEFRNFLLFQLCSEKFPSKDPNIVPATSLLQHRNITGEGSHRNLLTSIKLLLHSQSQLFEFVIVERLPLGVFADPFELQNLQQRRAFSDVSVFGDTNLELPSFRSNRSVVEIHVDISSREYDNGEITLKLPLHARYQPLDDSGYSRVEFGEPDLFLCSSQVDNQQHEQRRCLVLSIGRSKTETRSVFWDIPAGIRGHTEMIPFSSFLLTLKLRDEETKITYAESCLQGHIWRTGFECNELKSVVFENVAEALEKWHSSGIKVYIYSSGSRLAQRLLFGNTNYGDLRKYISGFFDTTIGNKKESRSYKEITETLGVDDPSEILFMTDVYQEATAAKASGLEAIISIRHGSAPLPEIHGFKTVTSFSL